MNHNLNYNKINKNQKIYPMNKKNNLSLRIIIKWMKENKIIINAFRPKPG